MTLSKSAFIRLAIENHVLKFGTFTLKSGRQSPYFFNAGEFYRGNALRQLGRHYANTIIENQLQFQHIFGPAYKGLPLATATAIALAELGIDTSVTFNRKEVKDHGEGGMLIGAPLSGKTLIIDDVISAGTAYRLSKQLIEDHGGQVSAVVIALDRCERGSGQGSTLQEIESLGVKVCPIITLFDLMDYLKHQDEPALLAQIEDYLSQYGC